MGRSKTRWIYIHLGKTKKWQLFSGVFQKIHESFDEIDSEKMYPFYVEKESSFAGDYGERKEKVPWAWLSLFFETVRFYNCRYVLWLENSWIFTELKAPVPLPQLHKDRKVWILWNTFVTTEQLEAPTLSICENGGIPPLRGSQRWAASNNNGEQRFVSF